MTSIGRTWEPGEGGAFARPEGAAEGREVAGGFGLGVALERGTGVVAADFGVVVTALGFSGSDPGASSGGGSWANAKGPQKKASAKEPTKLARNIERLSHFWKGERAIVKTHQYDRSVVSGAGILVFFCRCHDCATTTPRKHWPLRNNSR